MANTQAATPVATPITGNRVDAVIVGSGASGSLLAAKLAQSGKQVLILETGPAVALHDLISSQIWARRLKWSGSFTETGGANPIGVVFNSGWGNGGAALHHYAVWLRLHEEDFEVKSRFDVGLDWPFSYDALRPFYDRIQEEVGISGDAEKEIWRPEGDPYPMPALNWNGQGKAVARGLEALGMTAAPMPLAVNSVVYKGRAACLYDGWCDAGCPIGALANPLVTYQPQAIAAGAQLLNNATVTRVITSDDGKRADGVEYVDAAGVTQTIHADIVILSAFAVQNPRILLNSATSQHPDGLANSSGLIGVYMMSHPSRLAYGLFDDDTEPALGMVGGQVLNQDDYAKDPAKGYISSYGWLCAGATKPNDLIGIAASRVDLFGQPLHDFLIDATQHFAGMVLIGEDRAAPENRLTLSQNKDAFGMPLAAITHTNHPDDMAADKVSTEQGIKIMNAAGARASWSSGPAGQHIMGGTIMGTDPASSVTNEYGIAHDLPNLIIAGPGLFPTSGAVNPTFTIHAVTLRTADHLIDQWSTIAG